MSQPCHQQLPAAGGTVGGNRSAFVQFHQSTSSLSTTWMSSTPNHQSFDCELDDLEVSQLTFSCAFNDPSSEKGRNSVPRSSLAGSQ
jgi:hypothetical protein